jgi:SAM-dependent methyltransferase
MGRGRGAVLTAVARRLTTGRVTGVDIWSTSDQSGNAKDVTLRNATLEGVSDRVLIETADMRALPFADATFDLVVSSLAIHNIRSNADRKRAISEGFRVLKRGGADSDRGYPCHGGLCRCLADTQSVERGAASAGLEILVAQSGGRHNPPYCLEASRLRTIGPFRSAAGRHFGRGGPGRSLVVKYDRGYEPKTNRYVISFPFVRTVNLQSAGRFRQVSSFSSFVRVARHPPRLEGRSVEQRSLALQSYY